MLTLRAAATLLASIGGYRDLRRLLQPLGFAGDLLPLDRAARRSAGLPLGIRAAAVVSGPERCRVLLLDLGTSPARELLATCSRQLAARDPSLQLLLLAWTRGPDRVVIATPVAGQRSLRLRTISVDPRRVLDSDAETLALLAASAGDGSALAVTRWSEILGREAISARFYRSLERQVARLGEQARGHGAVADREEVALLHVSRLLFLSFLQAQGWLDGDRDFLVHRFDSCVAGAGGFHRRVLLPLFHGTLNTPTRRRAPAARAFGRVPFLNGGLFSRTGVERRCRGLHFSDEAWGAVFDELLSRFRFTSVEEAEEWSEAAIDPEMLGRAFESLMANRERRSSGSFYTPQALVTRIADRALAAGLEPLLATKLGVRAAARVAAEAIDDARVAPQFQGALAAALAELTVLDPACGSGAFLVYALERLAGLSALAGAAGSVHDLRRAMLPKSIFGVDRNPTATWLCQLRLWLSTVIDRSAHDIDAVPPLPNLDRNIRVGDALSGWEFDRSELQGQAGRVTTVRLRYARATGTRKETLARVIDREERARTVGRIERELQRVQHDRCELISFRRSRDLFGARATPDASQLSESAILRTRAAGLRRELRRLRDGGALPFSFGASFPEVAARGGFAVVLGNPPWVRLHRIDPADRLRWRREFAVFRAPPWDSQVATERAPRGFSSQVDLAALFTERAVRLLRPAGTLGFLLPVKLWGSLSGGGLRRFLYEATTLSHIEDCSADAASFAAAVYPSILIASRSEAAPRPGGPDLSFDGTAGAPWLLLPPDVRTAFDLLRARGTPLGNTTLGRPLLGAKCGCNEAFVVQLLDAGATEAVVRDANGREGTIERALLRPLIRGEHLRGWTATTAEWIIWPHDPGGAPLASLPPLAARWFAPWKRRLVMRADCRGARRWWAVFRVEGADHRAARVAWPDVARQPTAAVLPVGDPTVPLNSCYVLKAEIEDDAFALAAFLRSRIANAWLHCIAEPARGGYRRHLAWTINLLPLPTRWKEARARLAPIARAAARGTEPDQGAIDDAVAEAFDLEVATLAPLLEWAACA